MPDSVSKRGIGQFVAHAAEEFERTVKNGFGEDAETPFQKYAEAWLKRQVKYAPSTLASYERMLKCTYPYIGQIPLCKLRPIALENMLNELRQREYRGEKIREETAQKYLTVVSAVLSDAKRNEIIQKNPARIGHCTFCIPYAVVTIKGRISGDNDTLQEASMDLGANRVQTFWRVTIPSIMPGILSAAFLSFTLSIDDVIMSNMLASARQSTLPVLILSVNRTGITPDINALTTIMVLIMVTGMLLLSLLQRRRAKKEAEEMAETEKRISAMRNG